jgi:hypothetical protein
MTLVPLLISLPSLTLPFPVYRTRRTELASIAMNYKQVGPSTLSLPDSPLHRALQSLTSITLLMRLPPGRLLPTPLLTPPQGRCV